jgi:hypothetical protein
VIADIDPTPSFASFLQQYPSSTKRCFHFCAELMFVCFFIIIIIIIIIIAHPSFEFFALGCGWVGGRRRAFLRRRRHHQLMASVRSSLLWLFERFFGSRAVSTPALAYSLTRLSKKFVLPWMLMRSIHSNGLAVLKKRGFPNRTSSWSATNWMYLHMLSAFMPNNLIGKASHTYA